MGDKTSILALYLAHRGALLRYATTIVGDHGQAEDVVQEAWVRMGSATQGQALDQPVGYLYRIVRNLAVDGQRRNKREQQVIQPGLEEAAERMADSAPSPEAVALARNEMRLLAEAMAELPERTRIALEMRRLGGCKLKDIAAHLGISLTLTHEIIAEGLAHCHRRIRSRP